MLLSLLSVQCLTLFHSSSEVLYLMIDKIHKILLILIIVIIVIILIVIVIVRNSSNILIVITHLSTSTHLV